MKTETWRNFGGWVDKSEESDGNMYPLLIQINQARYINEVLGEHR
jgi:hypothetical protein